jgi:uncharacterized membrane protein
MKALPKLQPRLPRWLHRIDRRTLVGAALLGGILHICVTFAAPVLATFAMPMLGSTAYQQLRDSLPLNKMIVLPPPAHGRQILPFLPPDMLYAMCRYELAGGPIAVTAALTDAGAVLSLHTPRGDNFYVLPGQSLRRAEVSFLVVPSAGTDSALVQQRATAADAQVASPTLEGLIVVRLPIRGLAWQAETQAMLERASCTQVKR